MRISGLGDQSKPVLDYFPEGLADMVLGWWCATTFGVPQLPNSQIRQLKEWPCIAAARCAMRLAGHLDMCGSYVTCTNGPHIRGIYLEKLLQVMDPLAHIAATLSPQIDVHQL